jgi:steroid 5-alpha reductase family enzyme
MTISPGLAYLLVVIGLFSSFACVWLWQLKSHSSNMVDVVWTFGIGAIALFFAIVGTAPPPMRLLLAGCALVWSARLGIHVFQRNHGAPEDPRYRKFRDRWGAGANGKLFWLYEFQTVFSSLFALPFLVVAYRDDMAPSWAIATALVVWLVSVIGEAIADRQLAAFKKIPENKGRVNRGGLWHYSRHPNYFFECTHWFTYLFLAIGSPYAWVALIGPATMAFLMLKVSGIPITEEHLAKNRPEYAEYIRTTSALIPWPPRRSS